MKVKKTSPKTIVILILFFGFMLLYLLVMNMNLHRKLDSVEMPSYAERVLGPKTGYFSCCAGQRLGIEEVYRIPLDKVNDISYGETDRVVVEPFEASCYLHDLHVNVSSGFEHDCSYVYDYGDVANIPGYSDDDGYCYIHVWARIYLGSEDSFSLYLFAIFCLIFALPIIVVYLGLKNLAYCIIQKTRKKPAEPEEEKE